MHLKKINIARYNFINLPSLAGVYIFCNQKGVPIYIGKANNLKERLKSYFLTPLATKTSLMMNEAKYFSFIKVASELEALLLEAQLVRNNQPKFNTQLKDDKHPLYIRVTKEKYPRVLTARKLDIAQNIEFFGPFPSSSNVKNVLRMLRRIFPYAQHIPGKRDCLDSQIGLCNPCPSHIEQIQKSKIKLQEKRKYHHNIRLIRLVLSGKIKSVRLRLDKDMRTFANRECFEEALAIRKQIEKLDYITQPITPSSYYLLNPNLLEDIRQRELADLKTLLMRYMNIAKNITRIECFDVAHLAGTAQTASMVTFIDGEPDKSFYRHFRIKNNKRGDDVASLKEVLERRINHFEDWGKPNLVIVDGGKPQVSVFFRILKKYDIPVVGLAKRFENLVIPKRISQTVYLREYKLHQGSVLNLLQRVRNEAHRFARTYHHKLVKRQIFKMKD